MDCTAAAAWFLSVFNDQDTEEQLLQAHISLSGVAVPAEVATCAFEPGAGVPASEDFTITIDDVEGGANAAVSITVDCGDTSGGVANPDQADADADGVGDLCDLCPADADASNADTDADGVGDVCDLCAGVTGGRDDADGDGVGDECDLCPADADPTDADADSDGRGDVCDNCPGDANASQSDVDVNGVGDVCQCPMATGSLEYIVCAAYQTAGYAKTIQPNGGRLSGRRLARPFLRMAKRMNQAQRAILLDRADRAKRRIARVSASIPRVNSRLASYAKRGRITDGEKALLIAEADGLKVAMDTVAAELD